MIFFDPIQTPRFKFNKCLNRLRFATHSNHQRELRKKLGEDVGLRLEFVETISGTPRGKQRFLEQKLELAYGD